MILALILFFGILILGAPYFVQPGSPPMFVLLIIAAGVATLVSSLGKSSKPEKIIPFREDGDFSSETSECPYCLRPIHPMAKKCPHCHEFLIEGGDHIENK